ncbi:scarecrow-like protein 9 [Brachypodium distachyon]|nr:scarecrow-like protein 9 [Brachypodium distachyon]XP_024319188.1 scarecrow-like protein 9 [Brachypodium distachyon]|eukprot:XP_024319187.1 scarecrow-like protein 9 [Brachypodium distachyon]
MDSTAHSYCSFYSSGGRAMAGGATPEEEFLRQSFLARLEPPSPSLFLDLPPTPGAAAAGEAGPSSSSFDDMVLPYISQLLMEEEDMVDHFFYLYPQHPALLRAQLPFAQILQDNSSAGSAPTPSSSDSSSPADCRPELRAVQSSALPDGLLTGGDQDMLNLAFLKGMEEARKFLPPNTGLPPVAAKAEDGLLKKKRGNSEPEEAGRASKLMAPELEEEEDGARELLDEMMFDQNEICMKGVQNLQVSEPVKKTRNRKGTGQRGRPKNASADDEMVDLHTLLLQCAQAVSTDDQRGAGELLKKIKQNSSPTGDAAQRLAHYFSIGLEARLAGRGSELYESLMTRRTSVVDVLKANQLYMAACCCRKVSFLFSDKTIYNAVAGRSRLHIVDYGINLGLQWPALLRMLAAREGGPPEVRITGIDLPQPGFRGAYHIEDTGRRLSNFARVFGVPFKFHGIAAKRETVRPEDLNIDPDEVLVVISLCHFRHLMDENLGFDSPSPRDQVLNNIKKMRPNVFIHGILSGAYGATYFLTRFREALFHYSAHFDQLDVTVPRDNHGRLLLERDIFGPSALNVIACEGADRVERPETYKQWQLRHHRAGLSQLPLNPEVVKLVLDKVKDNYHKDFVVDEDQRWLVQRWKGRVLYALSAWVADDAA